MWKRIYQSMEARPLGLSTLCSHWGRKFLKNILSFQIPQLSNVDKRRIKQRRLLGKLCSSISPFETTKTIHNIVSSSVRGPMYIEDIFLAIEMNQHYKSTVRPGWKLDVRRILRQDPAFYQ